MNMIDRIVACIRNHKSKNAGFTAILYDSDGEEKELMNEDVLLARAILQELQEPTPGMIDAIVNEELSDLNLMESEARICSDTDTLAACTFAATRLRKVKVKLIQAAKEGK